MIPKREGAAGSVKRLPRNVWVLSWIALLNDASTEMGYWLLPHFLVGVLGAGPMTLGLIEGAAETVSSFSRLLSGWLSDRLGRRKPLVAAGYTLANMVKPFLALATSWKHVFCIRFADRGAKGIRGAPRDALIADSVSSSNRGAAFGLRQAMDSAGAVLGPLGALAALPLFAGDSRKVFWLAAIPGAACILLAWLGLSEVRASKPAAAGASSAGARPAIPWTRSLVILLAAVGLFSLGNSSDLFLVLRAQNLGVSAALAPALGLLFNLVYTLLSWPAGKLSDRIPRRALVVLGYLVYGGVYLGFARSRGAGAVWFLFAAYGVYYALAEGVIRAWIADLVPSSSRGMVFGVFNWAGGVTALPASLLAGWLWRSYSPAAPFFTSAVLSFSAALLLLMV